MRIFAIDPSTTQLGFCYDNTHGETSLNFHRINSKQDRPARLRQVFLFCMAFFEQQKPDVVIYYKAFHRGEAASRAAFGASGIIEALADYNDAAVLSVTDTTVRAYFGIKSGLPKGVKRRADLKQQSLAKASELGYNPSNDDEADAALLYHYAKENVRVKK